MNSLYRNYFLVAIVGMFSLLNSNMVSAQANDVACAGCIGWFEFAPDVRRRFIQQEARIEELAKKRKLLHITRWVH